MLDDHSDQRLLEWIKTEAQGLNFKIINLTQRGANHSALAQFKAAAECDGMVYVVEDDYLHEENALEHMLGAYVHFMQRYNMPTVIYPYDCSLRYKEGFESLTTLYHDGHRYWRQVDKTANTMLTHYSTIQDHWHVFEELARRYPRVQEDDTINKLYYSQDNPDAPIRAYNPIPSIAYHVGYSTPTFIGTDHSDWQHLWNRINNWELIQGWFYHPEFYAHVVNSLPASAKIVEVGAWRGRSTCCLASLVQQSGKNIQIYAVDTWLGSQEQVHQDIIQSLPTSLYEDFLSNLDMCGVRNLVQPMKISSVEASDKFDFKSLDFVMIDGAHDYDSVAADIDAWLPKIRSGGLIAGDDYSDSWPGVKRAVDERFGKQVSVAGTTWYVAV